MISTYLWRNFFRWLFILTAPVLLMPLIILSMADGDGTICGAGSGGWEFVGAAIIFSFSPTTILGWFVCWFNCAVEFYSKFFMCVCARVPLSGGGFCYSAVKKNVREWITTVIYGGELKSNIFIFLILFWYAFSILYLMLWWRRWRWLNFIKMCVLYGENEDVQRTEPKRKQSSKTRRFSRKTKTTFIQNEWM